MEKIKNIEDWGIRKKKSPITDYAKIFASEEFQNFLEIVDKKLKYDRKEWAKKFGLNKSTFNYMLRKYGLNYNTASIYLDFPEEKIQELRKDYTESIISIVDISKKYNIGIGSIYKLVGPKNGDQRVRYNTIKNNILNDKIDDTHFSKAKKMLISRNIPFEINLKQVNSTFMVNCFSCKTTIEIRPADIVNQRFNSKEHIYCKQCYQQEQMSSVACKKPLNPKINKSGFIGIRQCDRSGKVYGYNACIKFEKKYLFLKNYKDPLLTEKTLMEAVVDRERFIIDNNLSHTRNLTDIELKEAINFINSPDITELPEILVKLRKQNKKEIEEFDPSEFDKFFV